MYQNWCALARRFSEVRTLRTDRRHVPTEGPSVGAPTEPRHLTPRVNCTVTVTRHRNPLRSRLANGVWRVDVEDQGPGLPVELHGRTFERFARFNIPEDSDKGSGLGLTICRTIVELHGGRIFAESVAEGCGLRVAFEIPATAA